MRRLLRLVRFPLASVDSLLIAEHVTGMHSLFCFAFIDPLSFTGEGDQFRNGGGEQGIQDAFLRLNRDVPQGTVPTGLQGGVPGASSDCV